MCAAHSLGKVTTAYGCAAPSYFVVILMSLRKWLKSKSESASDQWALRNSVEAVMQETLKSCCTKVERESGESGNTKTRKSSQQSADPR